MINVRYFTNNCFHQNIVFVDAKAENSEENIKIAFKTLKKYDAAVFIEEDTNNRIKHGVRYNSGYTADLKTCVEKTEIVWVEGTQNETTPIKMTYNNALKDALTLIQKGVNNGNC